MTKKIIWYVVLPLVVLVSVYFVFFFNKEKKSDVTNTNSNSQNTSSDNSKTTETESGGSTTVTPLTGFSTDLQEVGLESADVNLTLNDITNTSLDKYYELKFDLTSDHSDSPYVKAEYIASAGVIRLSFSRITKDNGGLGYQKTISINKDGIIQLYHNISSSFDGEIYDVGVSKSAPFKLDASLNDDNSWTVTLDVQYPGNTDSNVDLGSAKFSLDPQTITGVDKASKATISSYSYSSSSGVLKIAWNVSSSDTNPIPAVSGEYDADGNLIVTFASLSTDRVVNATNGKSLPGGIMIESFRDGDSSIYKFTGMASPSSYRLSAGTSPNQVILEIKL